MPVEVTFEYDDIENILFAKVAGKMDTEQEALDTFEAIKNKRDQIGKDCWFISDVTELFPKSSTAIKYSKLSATLHGSWLGTVSIVKSMLQKSGMKLVGTFRKQVVHTVSSREEAYQIIEKLKSES